MKNPYSVLGISENASDEQVKDAYRSLARKYSSGGYDGGPLADVASKKMQEVDEAYDEIIMLRRSSSRSTADNGGSYSTGNSSAYTASHQGSNYYGGGSYYQYDDIKTKISQNRIDDAQTLLDGIPENARNAEWYYLKGTVQYRRGWFDEARKNFDYSCHMDPENQEYKAAFNNVNNFHNNGYRKPRRDSDDACDCCCSLLLADCCCECMGGDLIPCC